MRVTYMHGLLKSLLCLQLLLTASLGAQNIASANRQQIRQNVSVPNFPRHAPPEPWDDETCRSALHTDIHLTFSWGEPVRPTRLYRILEMGRKEIEALKRAGYGEFPLPERKFTIDYIPSIQMAMVAQKRRQIFGFKEFKLNDVLASIDLLELCGLARKEYFEMWAYVFVDDVQVGFIFVGRGDLRAVSSPPNGTSSTLTS